MTSIKRAHSRRYRSADGRKLVGAQQTATRDAAQRAKFGETAAAVRATAEAESKGRIVKGIFEREGKGKTVYD